MNPGIPLIVIFIFLVIWIVTNVIRAQQDAAQAAARRPERPIGASGPLPTQKGNSDIDRFLQEIDRLRRKSQPEQTPTAAKPPSTASGDQQRSRTATAAKRPVAERKRSSSGSERRPSVAPPATSQRPVPTMSPPTPAPPPLPSNPAPPSPIDLPKQAVSRLEMKLPDVQAPTRISAPSRPSRPAQAGAEMSASLQLLQTLFKSQQGAGVAVLLHEIFGEPKCHRKSQMPRGA